MASAYATFASGGIYAEPYGIKAIRDSRGKVIYEHQRKTHRAFDANQAGVLNAALQRVIGEGTGRAAALGRPVAGKTGTTSENVDAWFAGYVPQVSTAVWVGYDPARPMTDVRHRSVTGGSFPAAIFGDLMRQGLDGVPVKPLPVASPDVLHLHRVGQLPPPPPPPPAPVPPLPAPSEVPPAPELLVAPPVDVTPVTEPPTSSTTTTTTTGGKPKPTTTTTTAPSTTTTTRPATTTTTQQSTTTTTASTP